MIPRRIAIVGGSGAGKTTLARKLAELIDGVLVEVDAIQHKAHWMKAATEEISTGIREALEGKTTWAIDGICEREVGDLIVNNADVIVWLDLPLAVKLARLLRRSWRRVLTRAVLWNGNVETWTGVFIGRDSVSAHPLRTHFAQRRRMLGHADHAKKSVRLTSPREVDSSVAALLQKLDASRQGSQPGSFVAE